MTYVRAPPSAICGERLDPRAGSTGVVRRLCVRSEARLACQTATSVKVPPTSTAATTGSVTARVKLPSPVRRQYSGLDVGQHCVGHPVVRIAVTTTAGVTQQQAIARAHPIATFETEAVLPPVPFNHRRRTGQTPQHAARGMPPALHKQREGAFARTE